MSSVDKNESFKALRSFKGEDNTIEARLISMHTQDLDTGDVVIAAEYSSLNYKDALGITGKGSIYKKTPIIGGIDIAGKVVESSSEHFQIGESVLVTGCGLGETHDGGYSEFVRVPADWVISNKGGLTSKEAMIYGTAGFTAALSTYKMILNQQTPELGPIVVTGASGGVGSIAVNILSKLGFEVIAVSGKSDSHETLRELGANKVISPSELDLGKRPLESARYAGAVDNVGGSVLSGLLRHIRIGGNVTSIGLAEDFNFSSTVMPFILRGVNLLGISSTNCPRPLREKIWQLLSSDYKSENLERIHTQTISLDELPNAAQQMIQRQTRGRILVKISR